MHIHDQIGYELVGDGKTLAFFGNGGDPLYAPEGMRLTAPLTVSTTNSGVGGLGIAGSFILNEDQKFPASLAPQSSGYPGVSVGDYGLLDSVDSVALYLENQSGDLATIWPASFDAHHLLLAPGEKPAVRVGLDEHATPPFSQPHFYDTLTPEITKNFVPGVTLIDTVTVPACRAHVNSWTETSITVDRWLQIGTSGTPCGPGGDPQSLPKPAGVGIAHIGARNAVWLQNGNLALDHIDTTTRAITDELAVSNRTGHYAEHGFDPRFPGGLFPQADGPFVAGAIRFSSGTNLNSGQGGNGYQGTVAYAAAGDWEYGFWSRSARRAHFLVAPSDAARIGAVGLLDTEPVGKAIEVKPGNRADTFSIDRLTGDVFAKGAIQSGAARLRDAAACRPDTVGAHFYVEGGRKPGEARGMGSGVPADCTPPIRNAAPAWVSVYDHLPVAE